ncbi:cyclopropane-fatty-acyl-phospholipid synthase family protein [Hyphomicrobium sp. NDB2Meth4]|uniref:SAM-dependent methyltransferase n=1 Tax=Hyphomicrobium sp. NDB2Meth4 TaxID=1892846 RepID=UPI001FCD8692|nr:cyclopropane-fatty-acyl-phospholipid synthase family protein [Hyphomicrobium sp. NDB2Meth4]
MSVGDLVVLTPSGKHKFGDGRGPRVACRFLDSRAVFAFVTDPDLKLGELYMEGRLAMEAGSIFDLLCLLLQGSRNRRQPLLARIIDRARSAWGRTIQTNYQARSRSNVAHHYDLDERLYALFLDKDMQYSCAYFESEDVDLDSAQLAKKRHIAAKLALEPNHRVLDIGCGWGGLALYLSNAAGAASILGITLSEKQLRFAEDRRGKAGGNRSATFGLADFRQVCGTFDRIVSVGMFEHVGSKFYDRFFAKCHELLADDGIMLLHTIGCSAGSGFVMPWLNKYIFPGAYVPSLSEIVPVIERHGLVISDIEVLQRHYALTLRHWRERFLNRWSEAAILYDERFCRMWEFYLSAGEAAFRYEDVNVFQIQLTKKPAVTPLTRSYIGARESALLETERRQATAGT